jgi:FKBP-type peptidyl-prolyl cis-trans isomerase FklB
LQYRQIFEGPYANDPNAVRPDNAKIVTVRYSGKLINGYEFDSNESANFYVSDLVAGFTEGLKKMNQFDIYEFYIPYDLGYGIEGSGTEGTSSHIPPYSTLIFRVELLKID